MRSLKPLADVRQIHVIDALRYGLLMEARAYANLWSALRRIERSKETHPSEAATLKAFAAAWEVVDMAHRALGLAGQVRGLSQRTPEFRQFIRDTKVVTHFRNQFQHLNSHIPKIYGKTNPVLGTLSWVTKSGKSNYTMSLGGGNQDTHYHTIPFDTVEWTFAREIQLTAGGRDVDVTIIHAACQKFSSHVTSWLSDTGMMQRMKQRVGIVRVHLNRRPPS